MICIDLNIAAKYGTNAAMLVERLFFLTMSRKCNHPQYVEIDGRKWWDSSQYDKRLDALLHQFKADDGTLVMSKRTLQNLLAKLSPAEGEEPAPSPENQGEKVAPYLLDVVHTPTSIRIAINLDGLREAVGEAAFTRYEKLIVEGEKFAPSPESQGEEVAPSENEDEEVAPLPEPDHEALEGQGEEIAPSNGQGETAAPSSYIEEDSFDESLKPYPSSGEEGAISFKSPYQVIHQMVFGTEQFDVGKIGSIWGILSAQMVDGLPVQIDVGLLEDHAIWHMLFPDGQAWRKKFPTEGEYIASFKQFLRRYFADNELRRKIETIRDVFPNWLPRLFKGDYITLADEVKDHLTAQKEPDWRHQPYGADPIDMSPEMQASRQEKIRAFKAGEW